MNGVKEISILKIEDFIPLSQQVVKVRFTDDDIQETEIVDLMKLGGYTPADRTPFSFVLQTRLIGKYYNQGTYILIHPEKGEIPVFIVPLGFSKEGMRYEAIFS